MADQYPNLKNENERLDALRSYHILDTAEEKDFDELTKLAAAICGTPIALVSLVDKDRQWFKSHHGLAARETPRAYSFCAHAIAKPDEIMIIPDAKKDRRFADNPLVTGELDITFYAGVPLVNHEGFALGSLCIIDQQLRELSPEQTDALLILAKQVVDKLELKRKVAELETLHGSLKSSELNQRNLIQHAPVAIALLSGPDFNIESANEQMLTIWNEPDTITGRPLLEAMPRLAGKEQLQYLQMALETGKVQYSYEIKIDDRFFNYVYQPVAAETGHPQAVMVLATDVTEQVNARSAVNDSNERLAMALDAGRLGSYDLELCTGLMDCSNQCKANFGLNPGDTLNFPDLFTAILPEYREYVEEHVNTAIANNTIYQTEYQIQWPDGSRHWISAYGKPRYDAAGKPVRMVGITQNITQRKVNEQRKDDFLGVVSHELKTPITSLSANLQLMNRLKENPASPVLPKLIDASARSLSKISNLVDDLLNMRRFGEGLLRLEKTNFTIGELLAVSCNHIRIAGTHELLIEGDTHLQIFADENRIDQVLVNFVNNAVKYAPDSDRILFGIEELDGFAKISVRDFGQGIPKEQIPNLFDRYWRANHSGATYSGLGLGLYICAEIIKRHGGTIGADSEIGKGSTFWFTIPLTQV
ncbi:PAS domain S-box protein [Mucilaginibacter corticis]|uniref:histidine kinase n=1 Tax=Mucilaginibacter corticis TaxID=2597670 RepID=A0A556MM61_9SPHI|nr:ATP-binding protein [Mucilaginibacter corticis]TSJ41000.1 PAS domain S-box protein [Mucilaginibacter corticis]